jgi:ABC-2 type transport system permease protein
VLQSYQAGGNLFDTVQGSLAFNAYISADDKLPEELRTFRTTVQNVVDKLATDADGRLSVQFSEPEANDGAIANEIADKYGFRAQATSLFSPERFWFYLTVGDGEQVVQIPLDDMTPASFERNLKAGIKRFARGFTKNVAVVTPGGAAANPYAMPHAQFSRVKEFLGSNVNVQDEDLADGRVSGDADLLLLLAPESLDEKSLFAVDQFLMQGGTVIAATSPFKADLSGGSLNVTTVNSGLEDWLAHNGITLEKQLVMDPQNAAFPLPVNRNLGGFTVQEWRMLDYPYFPDLRDDGLNADSPITADLPQLTLAWSSPIRLQTEGVQERSYATLLQSSAGSWLSDSTDVMPMINADGSSGFEPEGTQAAQTLAVAATGRFTSYFAGKDSPLLASAPAAPAEGEQADTAAAEATVVSSVIEKSAESARLVVIASNDFLNDQIVQLLGTASSGEYQSGLQFIANGVDWALEDQGLLAIRSRGNFNRTLPPLEQGEQMVWEYLNYILAAIALGIVAFVQRQRQKARLARFAACVAE